jgi:molybdate transport system substrate-binding protein
MEEGLKRTLLDAKSIGYNGVDASRAGSEAMLRKLEIADAFRPKVKLLGVSAPLPVAKGEVEIGLGPASEILPIEGAQLAGRFPADLLASPPAAPVLKDKGMQPG